MPAFLTVLVAEPSSLAGPRRRPSSSGTRPRTATANLPCAARGPAGAPPARRLAHRDPQLRRRLAPAVSNGSASGAQPAARARRAPAAARRAGRSRRRRCAGWRRRRRGCRRWSANATRRPPSESESAGTTPPSALAPDAPRTAALDVAAVEVDQVELLEPGNGRRRVDEPQRRQQEARARGGDRGPAPVGRERRALIAAASAGSRLVPSRVSSTVAAVRERPGVMSVIHRSSAAPAWLGRGGAPVRNSDARARRRSAPAAST